MQSMRLLEFLYAITKSDTTEYEYDMDDPSDVKLYQLSQLNRKPISELLADKTDESMENPEYDNDILLSQSEEIRIDEEADKESRMFFSQIDNNLETDKVILIESSSESESESTLSPDESSKEITRALDLDITNVPECITAENDSSPLDLTSPTLKVIHYPDFYDNLMDGVTKDLQLKETLLSKNWLTDSLSSEISNYYKKMIC